MQINTGSEIYTVGVGWGSGGWGGSTPGYTSVGWGSPAPAGLGIGIQLRLWSQSNFGQNLILNPRGGALYYWVADSNPNTFNRAQLLASTNTNTGGLIVAGGVGIAGNLNIGGQTDLGTVANVHISGGSATQVLTTDGAGNLSWQTVTSGGTPGGTNTNVQFNDSGSFGGSANLT